MKLSEYKNEAAIELLADILEPATKILADEKIKELIDGPRISLIKYVLKNHKSEIIEILAIMDGVPVEEYECNFLTLPSKVMALLNDKDLMSFFK
jgi:hypothetical protein|nr:MAG TPA: hypothetical protein [Caudoviricetes sp.]